MGQLLSGKEKLRPGECRPAVLEQTADMVAMGMRQNDVRNVLRSNARAVQGCKQFRDGAVISGVHQGDNALARSSSTFREL